MIRFFFTFLLGVAIGLGATRIFPDSLPHLPGAVKSAATSLGITQKTTSTPAGYATTGPLSASISAEKTKDYDAALKEAAGYQRSGGDAFIAAERMGWLYYLKGAYPDAEQAYAAASRMHPAALNPVLGLLNVAEAMKDDNRIRRAAQAVLAIDPSNYRASMVLGAKSFASRDYRGAAFIYRKVVGIYPDDVDARSGLAWGEYYTGDTLDALSQFQLILKINPEYPFAKQGYNLVARLNGGAPSAP